MLNVDFCSYFANIFGIYLDTISALAGGCALTWRSFFHSCTDVWGSIKFAYLVYSWALSSVQCIWFDVEQVFREVTETVCGEREKRKKRFTTMRLASHYYRDTPPPSPDRLDNHVNTDMRALPLSQRAHAARSLPRAITPPAELCASR